MYPGRVCKAKVLRLNFVTLGSVVVSVLAFECRRSLVLIPGHVKHETIKLVTGMCLFSTKTGSINELEQRLVNYGPVWCVLSPVYTIQVLHPSLHSRKLGSRKLEFKFVYTRCKNFLWIHTSFGGRYNKQNGIFLRRGGCCPLYCIIMYNCTAKEIKRQKELNMGS